MVISKNFLNSGHYLDLSDTMKLSYLITLLKDEASSCLSGLQVSDVNYSIAKGIILKRYGDNYLTIKSHFDSLVNLPSCSTNVSSCKSLFDTIKLHVRSLQALNVDIDSHSVFLVPVLLEKFNEP